MIESLIAWEPQARVAVFCFDANTKRILDALAWTGVQTISLDALEDSDLRRVKPGRTPAEYCWTCTPATIVYCLDRLGFPECTYLDADLLFFASPSGDLGNRPPSSIYLTDHFYTPRYDQSATSGRYCVQFMYFKNDSAGRRALLWWRDACLEWCYDRFENGKFGDQKYLDNWQSKFEGVYVIPDRGFGVAPWNVQQYKIKKKHEAITLTFERRSESVVFYHFHALKLWKNGIADLSPYKLSLATRKLIYSPYLLILKRWEDRLNTEFGVIAKRSATPGFGHIIKRFLKGTANFKFYGKAA